MEDTKKTFSNMHVLASLSENPNTLQVIKLLLIYFGDKKVAQWLESDSDIYIIKMPQQEGSKTVTRACPAPSTEDWKAFYAAKPEMRQKFDADKTTIVNALKAALGNSFYSIELLKRTEREDGTINDPVKSLLPWEIWQACEERLTDRFYSTSSDLQTDLYHLEYDGNMKEFTDDFQTKVGEIRWQQPSALPDDILIPAMVRGIPGWRDPSHPLHFTCTKILSDLDDDIRKVRAKGERARRKMTLDIAIDRLLKRAKDMEKEEKSTTAYRVTEAVNLLQSLNIDVAPRDEFAFAALRGNQDRDQRWQRGQQLAAARPTPQQQRNDVAFDLPYRGMRGACWKCGSTGHVDYRTCPLTLRAARAPAPPTQPQAATGQYGGVMEQVMMTMQQQMQQQNELLAKLIAQGSRGIASGPLPTGAPAVAPMAATATPQASAMYGSFFNQPTFDPEELRRWEREEPAGLEPKAAWGSDDELDAFDA